jgi:hypothetical protein
MTIPRRLLASVRRRAFPRPLFARVPKGTSAMLRSVLTEVAAERARGCTGPTIYRSFMEHWHRSLPSCERPMCWHCESRTAVGHRIIFACLEAIAGGEE